MPNISATSIAAGLTVVSTDKELAEGCVPSQPPSKLLLNA